jgi:hypothetical protein
MNYSSSVAERAISALNRLLFAAMTSAWTSTLHHQHVMPQDEEDWGADDIGSPQDNSSAPDDRVLR